MKNRMSYQDVYKIIERYCSATSLSFFSDKWERFPISNVAEYILKDLGREIVFWVSRDVDIYNNLVNARDEIERRWRKHHG